MVSTPMFSPMLNFVVVAKNLSINKKCFQIRILKYVFAFGWFWLVRQTDSQKDRPTDRQIYREIYKWMAGADTGFLKGVGLGNCQLLKTWQFCVHLHGVFPRRLGVPQKCEGVGVGVEFRPQGPPPPWVSPYWCVGVGRYYNKKYRGGSMRATILP